MILSPNYASFSLSLKDLTSTTRSSLMKLVRDPPYPVTVLVYDSTFPGHRVATQYLVAALEGHLPVDHLLQYRAANSKLPGHPELGLTPGVKFSSGRLGHLWPMINGIALANRDKTIFCLGSDGSQQEGNDAEAARLAVAQNLNVKIIIDDNNVTIAGHPSEYLKGYDLEKTLAGHGLEVVTVQGEDIDGLWSAFAKVVTHQGPAASESPVIYLSSSFPTSANSCFQTCHGSRGSGYPRKSTWSRRDSSQVRTCIFQASRLPDKYICHD